jgi:hypothetical protein
MYRVMKPGGKFTVSDIVSVGHIPEEVRKDMTEWAGCVAGALDRDEYLGIARDTGFRDVTVVADKSYNLDVTVHFGLHSITVSGTR